MKYIKQRDEVVATGRLMWDKGLVSGYNGNISLRLKDGLFLVTASGTCLGQLSCRDVLLVTADGKILDEEGVPTSEKFLHLEIYRHFSDIKAIVHTHTPCINAFFLNKDVFYPQTLEAEHVLGQVHGVEQSTINVTDAAPILDRLRSGKMVVLRRHGVVSAGGTLFDCFMRIQVLEEQLWTEALSKIYKF